jgi:hypothetical protein
MVGRKKFLSHASKEILLKAVI